MPSLSLTISVPLDERTFRFISQWILTSPLAIGILLFLITLEEQERFWVGIEWESMDILESSTGLEKTIWLLDLEAGVFLDG